LLVICVNGKKFFKQNVVCKDNVGYDFKLSQEFDLNGNIAVVLYKINDYSKPLAWGLSGDVVNYKGIIADYVNNINKEKVTKTIYNNKETKEFAGKDSENIVIEDEVENSIKEDIAVNLSDLSKSEKEEVAQSIVYGCRDSDFKIESLAQAEALFDSTVEEVERVVDNAMAESKFFEMIKDQIEDLFVNYPKEENLERVVPNSRWVKVDYENNGNEYVVGLIYELETLKFVAYGVPARQDDPVPESLEEYSQWIPIDVNDPRGEGYFVMFQDAESGDTVKL